jgi:hypothetical protein
VVAVTRIQQVLFSVDRPYLGHAYYVTGNALFSAIARHVDEPTRRSLRVSHGVFVPGEYGSPTDGAISLRGGQKLGQMLPEVEAYEDLFVHRDPGQRWLSETRPRDAVNTHPLQRHGDWVAFAAETLFGRPEEKRSAHRRVPWLVQCYLHAADDDDDAVLPVAEHLLDGIRVGGARNFGLVGLSVVDSQLVDLAALDYSTLEAADEFELELVTPFVLDTEFPDADAQSVPWWWAPGRRDATGGLRRRAERLVDEDAVYELDTVCHGQVVPYAGGDPVGTARNGVVRVGTHSRFGFGEVRVRPGGADRVPGREAGAGGGG